MVADDPGIVTQVIKQIDHELTLAAQAYISALINITDVDQKGVPIATTPTADLSDAPSESAHVGCAIIIGSRQDMPMQVGRMKNGNRDRFRVEQLPGA